VGKGRARFAAPVLDGRHDDLPAQAFDFDGGIDEIVARATRP
jgi:hypothetical protein